MEGWESVKTRLDAWLRGDPIPTDLVYADIRAALERVEELEEANAVIPELMRFKWNDEQIRIATERAEAAEAEVGRLRDWIEWAGKPCDCGEFDSDQLVTRGECSDCRKAVLAPEVRR